MDWDALGTGVLGALGGGGVIGAYFRTRQAQAEAEPGTTAEMNKRVLLLFTRVAALEQKLEARDAQIDALQDQVRALMTERDEAREEAADLRTELEKLRKDLMNHG